jgi:hypothetical protein
MRRSFGLVAARGLDKIDPLLARIAGDPALPELAKELFAVALCRCMNIPARYCTGYLGDIGVTPDQAPMDFSAWFEAFAGGRWFTFDARHNRPRIGRTVMARGRDAADVAISTSFGRTRHAQFKVLTEELLEKRESASYGRLRLVA